MGGAEKAGTPQTVFDQGDGAHPPDIYAASHTASPITSWGAALSAATTAQYDKDGVVVVGGEAGFGREQVQGCLEALGEIVAGANERFQKGLEASYALAAEGRLDFKYGDRHPFIQFEAHAVNLPDNERQEHVRKLMGFSDFDSRLHAVAHDANLLALVRRVLHADADAPLLLFQDMALLKGVGGREKPWHQDHAFFNLPVEARVVGVWIALDEATPANGCMHYIPGLHHSPECHRALSAHPSVNTHPKPPSGNSDPNEPSVIAHFMRRDYQLCDEMVRAVQDRVHAVPLQPGEFLVFDSKLPHGTPTNHSNTRRRALQFHYAVAGSGRVSNEERMAAFGAEGKDVQC